MARIELGDRVKDRISGLKGIVTGITDWLYGCRRISVQPEEAKDGKPIETFCVDEPQVEVLQKGIIKPIVPLLKEDATEVPQQRRHGPRKDPTRF